MPSVAIINIHLTEKKKFLSRDDKFTTEKKRLDFLQTQPIINTITKTEFTVQSLITKQQRKCL